MTTEAAPPLLYRPEEAAEALGICRVRLFALIKSGEIASVKIGRSRRIARTSLETYVAALLAEQGK